MTITPEQARELLDGATPGPWEMLHTEWEDEEGTECEMWSVCDESDALMDTGPMWEGHDPEANLNLAAAAPDLAQTVIEQANRIEELEEQLAGVQWEYGVEQATGTTQWFRSRPMAEAHAEARGAFRIVRKPVGSVEVIDGE